MSKKAKDIIVGETVFNRGTSFIVKEVRVGIQNTVGSESRSLTQKASGTVGTIRTNT